MQELIGRIPHEWTLRNGVLVAPDEVIAAGKALAHTKFLFGSSADPMICGRNGHPPDIEGTMLGKNSPAEVEFGNAAALRQCQVLKPKERVAFASQFIQAGYRGHLKFHYGGNDDGDAYFACEIVLPSDKSLPTEVGILMEDEGHTGWGQPLLHFCKEVLQLKESVGFFTASAR